LIVHAGAVLEQQFDHCRVAVAVAVSGHRLLMSQSESCLKDDPKQNKVILFSFQNLATRLSGLR
jgi:hypothetical protein